MNFLQQKRAFEDLTVALGFSIGISTALTSETSLGLYEIL